MTKSLPFRRTILHLLHIFLTDARTFIIFSLFFLLLDHTDSFPLSLCRLEEDGYNSLSFGQKYEPEFRARFQVPLEKWC